MILDHIYYGQETECKSLKKKGTRHLDLESSFLPIAYFPIHIRSTNLISIDNYMTVSA